MVNKAIIAGLLVLLCGAAASAGGPRGMAETVTMLTGSQVTGTVIAYDDQVLVMEVRGFPCAIAFEHMMPDSAYGTLYALYGWTRGGLDRLTADDHLRLGVFALERNRYPDAQARFKAAIKLDPSYQRKVEAARRAFRGADDDEADREEGDAPPASRPDEAAVPGGASPGDAEARGSVTEGYKALDERVRTEIGKDVALLETPHFLIWTDWAKADHRELQRLCEQMYGEVSRRFGLDAQADVFAGKCPVFCLRSRARFEKAARVLDGYEATDALGYTSASANGHVHVVVCRQGGWPAGRRAFAGTLIHESTHAFLHRYRGRRHIPAWLNEGLANYIAEAVLQDRCSNGEAAEAVARAIAAGGQPLGEIFSDTGPLDARHYPVAHSLVSFLMERDATAFARLIDDLKDGVATADALQKHFGFDLAQLEALWRQAHTR